MKAIRKAAIIGGIRTPFVKSFTNYSRISNQELLTATLKALVEKYNLQGQLLGDVAAGAVIKSSKDWNLTRESVLGSGLHPHTPGYDVQRACGTGLETTWHIAMKIACGMIENGIAGGCDTNSDLPILFPKEFSWKLLDLNKSKSTLDQLMKFLKFSLKDLKPQIPGVLEPRTKLSMGQHTEKMVQEWGISQKDQDALALKSHQTAAKAYDAGFYNDLIFEFKGLKKDTMVRGDSSIEKLSKLKPAFDFTGKGTLTAGNSSPLTDGASAVYLTSEAEAERRRLTPLAYFVDCEVSAVDFVKGEGLLMAPTLAVSKLLERNHLSLQDFDYYEIHEAFAGQVLCTLKAWESADYCRKVLKRDQPMGSIDRSKMNVKGGSVALGHPFAATGARIVASLAKMLAQHKKDTQKSGRGLISICTAGGMGIAAILES